ncbi:MAG: transglycosylase SLT domain-containing protein [Myxococcota bacterium]|nr:transglycosylase SLT domain-containing protein [Myxococcota bacterium]
MIRRIVRGLSLGLLMTLMGGQPAAAKSATKTLGPNTPKIRELMARKQWARAARLISSKTPEAHLVKGTLRLKAKDPKGALKALSKAIERDHPLIDFAHLRRAEAYLALDQAEAVEQSLTAIGAPQLFGDFYRRLMAWSLREQGKLKRAKAIYQALILGQNAAEVPIARLGLARVAMSEGDVQTALNHLRTLDVHYPRHWATRRAHTMALKLGATHPTLIGLWSSRTDAEALIRSKALLDKHRNQEAVRALTRLSKRWSAGKQACEHQYALGRGLRKLRRWKRAYPILKNAVKVCRAAGSELEPWAIHLLGKASERLGREDESVRVFKSQVERHATHRLADDAAYFIVRDAVEDREDLNLAESLLTRYTDLFPHGDMMHDAIFFVVAQAFARQEYRRAKRVIDLRHRLSPAPPKDSHLGRGLYWEARILGRLDQRQQSVERYRETMRRYPLSWYGFLAYSRLKELEPAKVESWVSAALIGETLTEPSYLKEADITPDQGPRWRLAAALARVGLAEDAWDLLKGGGLKDDASIWRAARLLDAAGAHAMSHDIVRRRLATFRYAPSTGASRSLWTVAYPQPLKMLVGNAAKAAKIPAHFVRAVIREESGFRPAIESFANAVGLMQILVPTGQQIAKRHEGRITRSRLQNPDLNVALGARYLAHVRQTTGAQDALIPPGYNAGPGAVKRWLRARGRYPLDLFVELIPYQEARDYTKKVMASYGVYTALYNPGERLYIGQNTRAKRRSARRAGGRRTQSRKRRKP